MLAHREGYFFKMGKTFPVVDEMGWETVWMFLAFSMAG
jgi:hypothetical protein